MIRFLTLGIWMVASFATAQGTDPALVSVALAKAYVPVGFDSNDVPQFMVTGQFSDLCFQLADQDVKVDPVHRRITVVQKAYQYTGTHCWPLKMPFEQMTNLPVLPAGDYEIWDGTSQSSLGTLPILRATNTGPGTDDAPYAPVSDVTLKPRMPFGHDVVVSGIFPNDCLSLLDIRVEIYTDVVVVMPVIQYTPSSSGVCTAGYYPFRQERALSLILGQHAYLLHARSMNGKAVNRLIEPHKKFPMDPTSPLN